ncbi:amino acid adenylation domain-containing protein [Oxalobacteraceae bacterium GrIS 2.11]
MPEKTALIFEDQKLTYRQLNQRANQLANYLKKHHDINPDTLIGMSLERGIDCIVSMLAILKAGGAYVPLDPAYPKARLQFMLQDTNAEIILTQENLVQHLPATEKNIVLVERDLYNDYPASNPRSPVQPQHLAYVLYTSGTTGRPKGVMVEHRNVVQLVKNQNYFKLSSQDVMAQTTSINFDVSMFEIWDALLSGLTLCVLPLKTILSGQLLKTAIQKNSITICSLTSALFDQLVLQDPTLFSGLNYLFVSGDALNPSTVVQVFRKKVHRPKAIMNAYGPTETTVFATSYRIPEDFQAGQHTVPIGLPLCNTQTYILDDHFKPVLGGTIGELYIGGAGLARGYLNLPDITEQKFIANPFATADDKKQGKNLRLYRSGDLARYLADGNIEFMGRRDQQVKVRGFRIECGEIEHALLSHNQIAQVVVKAVEHSGEKQLVAYYVPKKGLPNESENRVNIPTKHCDQSGLSRQDLQVFLQTCLPEYMIPQHFVPLDALPLNSNGKLDVQALPNPETAALVLRSTAYVAPSNPVEVQLEAVWSEVLGQKEIGIHDDFFELGGSSLSAMSLVNEINKNLNVKLNVSDLFSLKNIAGIAQKIALADSKNSQENPRRHSEINKYETTESETLILRDYFLSEFTLAYNESFVVEVSKSISLEKFRLAVVALFSECEILHANYFCIGDVFSRKINKTSPIECEHVDISHCPNPDVEFLDRINVLVKKEFNIGQDKLVRFYLFQLAENRYNIFVVFFHALLDATSINILCKKLFQHIELDEPNPAIEQQNNNPDDFYLLAAQIRKNYKNGRNPEDSGKHDVGKYIISAVTGLVPESLNLEREQRTSDHKLAYWREFFSRFDYCPISPIAGPSKSRLGKQEAFIIGYDVKENLLALSKKLHISLFDMLFGCFMLLLNKFTQQNNIAVRTNIDERLFAPQYAQTVGCFVNNLFLGVEINADATLINLLIDSKKNKDQAIRNGLSYDALVECFREKIIDLSRVHFNLELGGSHDLDFSHSQIQTHSGQVKNDLYVELDVKKDKILAQVQYKSELFDKNFIDSLIQCYTNILEKAESFLNQPIKNINILPGAQYQKVVHRFNADKSYPNTKTIHQIFEEQAKESPKKIAVSCNGVQLTYGELNAKANQLAHYLQQHATVVPGELVTLCLEKSEQILIAILAVLKVGAAYCVFW